MIRSVRLVVAVVCIFALAPSRADASPQGATALQECARATVNILPYDAEWRTRYWTVVECRWAEDDTDLAPRGYWGWCDCEDGTPRRILVIVEHGMARYDVACRLAHEYGHAWWGENQNDKPSVDEGERRADRWAQLHVVGGCPGNMTSDRV